jgi:beta-mannanase
MTTSLQNAMPVSMMQESSIANQPQVASIVNTTAYAKTIQNMPWFLENNNQLIGSSHSLELIISAGQVTSLTAQQSSMQCTHLRCMEHQSAVKKDKTERLDTENDSEDSSDDEDGEEIKEDPAVADAELERMISLYDPMKLIKIVEKDLEKIRRREAMKKEVQTELDALDAEFAASQADD